MQEIAITNGREAQFGPVRLSFPHLFEKDEKNDKFTAMFLIPKTSGKIKNAIDKITEEAAKQGRMTKWHGKLPANLSNPLGDGDMPKRDGSERGPEMKGNWFVNVKTNRRPLVVDSARRPILDADEAYGGCWVMARVTAFPYEANGNNGVSLALDAVMKVEDGDRFGGELTAANAFDASIIVDDEDY